jgi:small GTP-binding protein
VEQKGSLMHHLMGFFGNDRCLNDDRFLSIGERYARSVPHRMRSFKAVLLGEGRVGKTSIGLKYTQGIFDPHRKSTIQAGFYSKKCESSQGQIELNLWDTAGQEEYHAVAQIYYKNAQAALLVDSVVEDTSFERMVRWHGELRQILGNAVKIFVVANKIDLPNRQITPARRRLCEFDRLQSL